MTFFVDPTPFFVPLFPQLAFGSEKMKVDGVNGNGAGEIGAMATR